VKIAVAQHFIFCILSQREWKRRELWKSTKNKTYTHTGRKLLPNTRQTHKLAQLASTQGQKVGFCERDRKVKCMRLKQQWNEFMGRERERERERPRPEKRTLSQIYTWLFLIYIETNKRTILKLFKQQLCLSTETTIKQIDFSQRLAFWVMERKTKRISRECVKSRRGRVTKFSTEFNDLKSELVSGITKVCQNKLLKARKIERKRMESSSRKRMVLWWALS